jgi:tetratricopeptide (TPR) repeat protein
MRKGDCLLSLDRLAEAQAALRAGLASLTPDAPPVYQADVAQAHMSLGRIAYEGLDYGGAAREFALAGQGEEPRDRLERLLWLARVTMFDEGPQAAAYADEALALAAATPGTSKKTLADLHTLHARVLLNHARQAEAYAELKSALAAEGGLTERVDVSDVITRSDLAIAALLNGDREAARKDLVYSGSGRLDKGPFASAAAMSPPPCGGAAGLRLDDVGIVEFGISDDGSIAYARPIYASRNGPAAVAFARAVADWSWRPEATQVLPPLFRLVNRVELRCSTASERPSVIDLLKPDFVDWLVKKGAPPFAQATSDAASVAPARAELARREAVGEGVALLPVLLQLAGNPVVDPRDRHADLTRAREIMLKAGAPPAARAYVEIMLAGGALAARRQAFPRAGPAPEGDGLRALLAQPTIANDARASAALRLEIADSFSQSADEKTAFLQQVAADTRLSPHDPFRVGALVRLASLEARKGDLDAARASYQKTGLSAQQCSLVDARPTFSRIPSLANAFPLEAQRWGFEGWVRTEFDISADGATLNQRAVIAYPPFVFRDAAVGVTKDLRFTQTYRPEGGPGCNGAQQSINFRLPR